MFPILTLFTYAFVLGGIGVLMVFGVSISGWFLDSGWDGMLSRRSMYLTDVFIPYSIVPALDVLIMILGKCEF